LLTLVGANLYKNAAQSGAYLPYLQSSKGKLQTES